jgi:DNA polymerase-1
MSAFGLAKQLGVGREEAQHYMHRYFARYPGVESYMEKIKENARQKGYVETLFGRRLYLPQINAKNGLHRAAAERTAINAPMQGTAADIIKKAMLNISTWIEQENIPLVMIMQVHDELVFEVPEDQANDLAAKIADKMEQATELNIPLKVDVGIGMNWDEAH